MVVGGKGERDQLGLDAVESRTWCPVVDRRGLGRGMVVNLFVAVRV